MNDGTGLRERKKQRTRRTISDTAIDLFVARGFDQVSVVDIAEAAEVSKRTLFAYFPTKEDLVVHRFADHETESGRVVRARGAGQSPLDALSAHFHDRLRDRDANTGLSDRPAVLALYELIYGTPALAARLMRYAAEGEAALAGALRETAGVPELPATLAACQILPVLRTLSERNVRKLIAGASADDVFPEAVADAELAFALLRAGLATLGT